LGTNHAPEQSIQQNRPVPSEEEKMKARLVFPVIVALTLLLGACSPAARAPEKPEEAPAAVEMQQPVAVQVEGESVVEAPAVQAPALMATAAPAAAPRPPSADLPRLRSRCSSR
jgi:hypothetical protein